MSEPIHIISLGAGVQSSTMALMAAKGEITPMPAFGIFADTQDESAEVYQWLAKLRSLLPFSIHYTSKSKLSENLFRYGHSVIPCFTKSGQGSAIGKRQCTTDWKIEPIQQMTRLITGTKGKRLPEGFFTQWIGISVDEVSRAKDSRHKHTKNRFPLLELGMNRRDCIAWLERNGFSQIPKSACVYCPYRSRHQWRMSKQRGGAEWGLIVKVSRLLEARQEFLTSDCLPIGEVDFSTDEERGQTNMFNNECEGMCGV